MRKPRVKPGVLRPEGGSPVGARRSQIRSDTVGTPETARTVSLPPARIGKSWPSRLRRTSAPSEVSLASAISLCERPPTRPARGAAFAASWLGFPVLETVSAKKNHSIRISSLWAEKLRTEISSSIWAASLRSSDDDLVGVTAFGPVLLPDSFISFAVPARMTLTSKLTLCGGGGGLTCAIAETATREVTRARRSFIQPKYGPQICRASSSSRQPVNTDA
jgi:hypothetical protein